MTRLEKALILLIVTVVITVWATFFIALLVYEEPQRYIAPCRGPGHVELPESECGR